MRSRKIGATRRALASRRGGFRASAMAMFVAITLAWALPASGQSGWSNYGMFEAQRRGAIALQLETQEALRARSGFNSRLYPGLRPYSLESIYAGLANPLGARSWGSPDVFEPWPFVPGDIYGRQFDFGAQTPLGHVTTYTGPNSYVYEPFYAAPLAPQTAPPPAQAVLPPAPPWFEPTAPQTPPPSGSYQPEELPPPADDGLREF